MKSIILTAALLVLAVPAHASSAAEWECPGGFSAVSTKGIFTITKTMGSEYGYKGGYPARGSSRFAWDLRRNGELWINGKLCKTTN